MNMPTYKIGTRGSLLAQTQATQVMKQLEGISGFSFALKTIKTLGDGNTSKPLWQLEGQNFFTKELDQALLDGEVDLVVHSYKDLGSQRPKGIELGAVTERFFAQDILLIADETVEKLKSGSLSSIVVGTSSPRRVFNVESSLSGYLPSGPTVSTKALRGNINTRIEKLHRSEYHCIVLALAGLERLAQGKPKELAKLLAGLNYMLLPLGDFPAAAAQGSLAVEISSNCPPELRAAVKKLEHSKTKEEIDRERAAFQRYGGGCHLAVGITVQKIGDRFLCIEKGDEADKFYLEGKREKCQGPVFIGLPSTKVANKRKALYDQMIIKTPLPLAKNPKVDTAVVTSTYCLENLNRLDPRVIVASGSHTHKTAAKEGGWVNICGDALGEKYIAGLLDSKALQILRPTGKARVLTSNQSTSPLGETIPCYKRESKKPDAELAGAIAATVVFYWTSFPQYQIYLKHFPSISNRQHACGVGKTWEKFKAEGISVMPFANMEEFYLWAGI